MPCPFVTKNIGLSGFQEGDEQHVSSMMPSPQDSLERFEASFNAFAKAGTMAVASALLEHRKVTVAFRQQHRSCHAASRKCTAGHSRSTSGSKTLCTRKTCGATKTISYLSHHVIGCIIHPQPFQDSTLGSWPLVGRHQIVHT